MKQSLVALGSIFIILGLIIAIIFYPILGYATAGETSEEISEFSFDSISGKEVKFMGTIEEVWTDEIPYVSALFDLVGLCIFTVEDLEVDSFLGGLLGGSDTIPVLIFSDNMDISSSDTITVEGYAFGWSDVVVIIGDSGLEAITKMTLGTPPTPANVEICPQGGFYVGIIILIIGFLLAIAGIATKKTQYTPQYTNQYTHQYQPQSQPQPGYQSQPPPSQIQSGPNYPCRYCGQSLTFVHQYQRWYCERCRQYN